MGRGQRDLETGSDDDSDSGTKLDRETTGGGNLGNLHTDGGDDLVTVESETHHDTDATQGKNPEAVVSEVIESLDYTGRIHRVDGSEGTHGVGDVIGAVREGIAGGGKHLHVLEGLLSAGVEVFGVIVDGGHVIGVFDRGVDVPVDLALHEADDTTRGRRLIGLQRVNLCRYAS